jgi:DNA-binding XRE family transcriptional regulator
MQKNNAFHKVRNKIREYRTLKKMTQRELAEEIGVHRFTVIKWEAQELQPKAKLWEELAEILDCEEGELFYLL